MGVVTGICGNENVRQSRHLFVPRKGAPKLIPEGVETGHIPYFLLAWVGGPYGVPLRSWGFDTTESFVRASCESVASQELDLGGALRVVTEENKERRGGTDGIPYHTLAQTLPHWVVSKQENLENGGFALFVLQHHIIMIHAFFLGE